MLETESNQKNSGEQLSVNGLCWYYIMMLFRSLLGLTRDSNVFSSYCGLKVSSHCAPCVFMIFASELTKLCCSLEDDISVRAERR